MRACFYCGRARVRAHYHCVTLNVRVVVLPDVSLAVIVMGLNPRTSGIGPAVKVPPEISALPLVCRVAQLTSATATLSTALPRTVIVAEDVP
jgi:hypothetical protein